MNVEIAFSPDGLSARLLIKKTSDSTHSESKTHQYRLIRKKRHQHKIFLHKWTCLPIPFLNTVSQNKALPSGNDTKETVKGFTAVSFQHKWNHLDGILYTDSIE